MGAQNTKPELAIYKAVEQNNHPLLERELQALRASNSLSAQVLSYTDKEGRNPLLVAAARNHYECARTLLDHGVDIHYINPHVNPNIGGTALHEATRKGHEPMVQLLLSRGASPFQSSPADKTCMDEAVQAGSVNLLRIFETHAPWRGQLSVKTTRLGGLAQPWKTRYIVVCPVLPMPTSSNPHPPQRKQLWVFKDVTTALVPKVKVSLDGATIHTISVTDIVLRLHANHKQPQGDVFCRYDRGYCLYLRSRDATQACVEALHSFMWMVSRSTPSLEAPPSGASTPALSSHGSTPLPASSVATPAGSAGGNTTNPAPPAAVPPREHGSERAVTHQFVDVMSALPGETDEDFASRLASAISICSGHDQSGLGSQPSVQSTTASTTTGSFPGGGRPATAVAAALLGSAPSTTSTPSASSSHPSYPAVPAAHGVWGAQLLPPELSTTLSGVSTQPSAPPQPAAEDVCVICLSAPREAGYLHGSTLHRCVCRDCCNEFKEGDACPLCRQTVERVVGVF